MPTGEMPAQDQKPVSHSSTITLALAIVALAAGGGGAFAAGKALTKLELVEEKQREHSTRLESQDTKNGAQDLLISGQGKDIQTLISTTNRIDARMERWEERGFIPARGNPR